MFSTISVGGSSVSADRGFARYSGIHALIALGLLGQLGQVDGIFVTHFGGCAGYLRD
jgi:hypothetical protein